MSTQRCAFAFILVVLLGAGTTARSQALPPDAAVAINRALYEGRRAIDNTGRRAAEAALMSSVVTSIAAHPGSARTIVAFAVAAAPMHRDAIIARASAAFPGFAGQFNAPLTIPPPAGPVFVATPPAPPVAADRAEDAEPRDPSILDLGYLESYPLNAARLLASPWRFDRSDWIDTAFVLGIGGGLMALDSSIRDFIQGDVRGGASNDVSDFFHDFGDTRLLAIGLGATYVGGELIGDRRLRETALLAEESLLLASVLGLGIKWVTQRDRPNTGNSPTSWSPFSFDTSNTSFPSGHAINAFSVASVIASEYQDYALVGPLAYGVATATALSRLNQNKHWASDVFVGAAIGYFIGKMIVRFNPFNPARGVTVRPWGGADSRGLSLAIDY